jgi:hypothetical protein
MDIFNYALTMTLSLCFLRKMKYAWILAFTSGVIIDIDDLRAQLSWTIV